MKSYRESVNDYKKDKKIQHFSDSNKHPKKKPKRKVKKADHKHTYKNCGLLRDDKWLDLGSYCTICGKISSYHPKKDNFVKKMNEKYGDDYHKVYADCGGLFFTLNFAPENKEKIEEEIRKYYRVFDVSYNDKYVSGL